MGTAIKQFGWKQFEAPSRSVLWLAIFAPALLLCLAAVTGVWYGLVPNRLMLSPGTVLEVSIDEALSSETTESGDVFEGRVVSAEALDGSSLELAGARATVRLAAVRSGSGQKHPGYLRLALESVRLPGGTQARVKTTTLSEWADGAVVNPPADNSKLTVGTVPDSGTPGNVTIPKNWKLRFALLQPVWVDSSPGL